MNKKLISFFIVSALSCIFCLCACAASWTGSKFSSGFVWGSPLSLTPDAQYSYHYVRATQASPGEPQDTRYYMYYLPSTADKIDINLSSYYCSFAAGQYIITGCPKDGRQNNLGQGIGGGFGFSEYFMIESDLPIYVDGEQIVEPPFHLASYLDGDLVYHFSVSSDDTIGSNDSCYVSTYLIDGTLSTPQHSGVIYPTYSFQKIPYPNADTYDTFFEFNFPDVFEALKYQIDGLFTGNFYEPTWFRGYYYTTSIVQSGTSSLSSFDIRDYQPYEFVGNDTLSHHKNPTKDFSVDVPALDNLNSQGGLFAKDALAFIAVVDVGQGESYVLRYDFKRSDVKALRHTPNYIVAPITPIQPPEDSSGTVTDWGSMAQYIQYVYNTTNNNTAQDFNNLISDLQNIPWSSYISSGFQSSIPALSAELDSVFGSLFDYVVIPSDDKIADIKAQSDQSFNEFRDKFSWHNDIVNEIDFIVETILTAGDEPTKVTAVVDMGEGENYYFLGELILFDPDNFSESMLTHIKSILNVFMSIGLAFYIYRTLPSTIGREPN